MGSSRKFAEPWTSSRTRSSSARVPLSSQSRPRRFRSLLVDEEALGGVANDGGLNNSAKRVRRQTNEFLDGVRTTAAQSGPGVTARSVSTGLPDIAYISSPRLKKSTPSTHDTPTSSIQGSPASSNTKRKSMATNIEIWNERRKKHTQELDSHSPRIKALLQRYVAEMKKDHAYIVRNSIAAARLDTNMLERPPGVAYDEVSPFAEMGSLDITATKAKDQKILVGKFNIRHYAKVHAASEHKLVIPAQIADTSKDLPKMPRYHSYTTLRNNILAEDDEVMRYFPYFGEDAKEDDIVQLNLEETFVDRTRASAEEGRKSERAAMYTTFIKDFLKELELSVAAVTHYMIGDISAIHGGSRTRIGNEQVRKDSLPNDFDLEDPKLKSLRETVEAVSLAELERAEPVCRVFKEQTKISMWEVIKRANQTVKDSISPARLTTGAVTGKEGKQGAEKQREDEIAALTGGNPQPYSLESYAALNCLLCFMHECPFHVNKDQDRLAMAQAEEANESKGGLILNLATNLPGWSSQSKGAAKDPWGDNSKFCSDSCFLKSSSEDPVSSGDWSPAQTALLRSSISVLKNNPRAACLIASVINKTCAEIYKKLGTEKLFPELSPSHLEDLTLEPKQSLKRKKPMSSALPGYPSDCDKTHSHDKRTHFQACRHLGHCSEDCPCVQSHVTCEKSCTCLQTCPRRWKGCSCKRDGRPCTVEKCPCVKANRECDPDLCRSCGAHEALDPMNRYDDNFIEKCCQNVALQRDMPKRTLLGRSAVAGFGLFVGEDVKAGSFLGEYKGEVISSEEAERRGKLYDKRGVSFLFNLNANQVIDATRAGNKFRYVNHSSKRPNCGARVYMANCTHRIGMFAKRDMRAGEELFFDYGYNNKQIKFVQKEPPDVGCAVSGPVKRSKPKPVKRSRNINSNLEYLKGGKGTTERSRAKNARSTATTTATATTTSTKDIMPRVRASRRHHHKSAEYVNDSDDELIKDQEGEQEVDPDVDEDEDEDNEEEDFVEEYRSGTGGIELRSTTHWHEDTEEEGTATVDEDESEEADLPESDDDDDDDDGGGSEDDEEEDGSPRAPSRRRARRRHISEESITKDTKRSEGSITRDAKRKRML